MTLNYIFMRNEVETAVTEQSSKVFKYVAGDETSYVGGRDQHQGAALCNIIQFNMYCSSRTESRAGGN